MKSSEKRYHFEGQSVAERIQLEFGKVAIWIVHPFELQALIFTEESALLLWIPLALVPFLSRPREVPRPPFTAGTLGGW